MCPIWWMRCRPNPLWMQSTRSIRMRAIIVGCGRAGAELANRLARAGHWVTVIDVAAEAFDNLAPDFRGHVIEAEVLNRDVLVNAGIREADSVATLTN